MPKYISNSGIQVEAVNFLRDNFPYAHHMHGGNFFRITIGDKIVYAQDGDYIITNSDGSISVMSKTDFEANYRRKEEVG